METIITSTNFIASLGTTGLLALIIVVLAYIANKLYKEQRSEQARQSKDIINQFDRLCHKIDTSNQIAMQSMQSNEKLHEMQMKFIQEHCGQVNNKIDDIEDDIKEMKHKINTLKE